MILNVMKKVIIIISIILLFSTTIDAKRKRQTTRKRVNTTSTTFMVKESELTEKAKELLAKAKQGDANAQFEMAAYLIDFDDGVTTLYNNRTRFYHDAFYWAKKADAQNHPGGAWLLAKYYDWRVHQEQVEDYEEYDKIDYYLERAHSLAKDLAEAGDPVAQYVFATLHMIDGSCYCGYLRFEDDECQSYDYLEQSAEKGYYLAQFRIGYNNYEYGDDYEKAAFWFKKAAEQDHRYAKRELAVLYANGWGVEQNNEIAAQLWKELAELGDVESQATLSALYGNGVGIPQDEDKSEYWMSKAEENGYEAFVLYENEEKESSYNHEMDKYSALNGVWHLSTNRNLAIRITLYPSSGSVKFELWVGRAGVQWVEYPDAHYVSPGQIYVNGGADFGKVTFRLSGNSLVGSNGKTYYK